MTFHRMVPLFVLMLDLLLLGAALASNGRRSRRNRAFAWLSLALCAWSVGALGLRWSEEAAAALAWERLLHLGVIAIPVLFYRYVWELLGDRRRRTSLIVGYALAGSLALVLPTPLFMRGVEMTRWGYAPQPGPLYNPFLVYFFAYMVMGLVVLVRAYPNAPSPFRRNRLRLVLFGVAVSLIGGIVDFLRFLLAYEWIYPAGIPASAVFAFALGVAIVRYRLMNITAILRHALLYALAWAAVAPIVLIAVEIVERVVPEVDLGRATLVLTLAGVALGLPLMRKLEGPLDRIMFRRRHAMSEAVVALNRELSGILDVPRLATTVTRGLTERIPVAHAELYAVARRGEMLTRLSHSAASGHADVEDGGLPPDVALWVRAMRRTLIVDEMAYEASADGPGVDGLAVLERRRVALVVPVIPDTALTALLLVGEKLSGEVFDPGEIELLEVLATRAGIALKNAQLYQELEAQMAELRTTQHLYGEARAAGRAQEQFLAMLAHELRNPLAPIVSAGFVLDKLVGRDPKLGPPIGMIRRQAQQLSRLLDDLLDVSRIQLGKIHLNKRPVDLGRLLAQCVETLRSSGKGHEREIVTRLPSTPVVVRGDAVRLEQIFWNLLDNALKYSPAGTPVIVTLDTERDWAVASVRDEGIGIAPEMLNAVFELFTQADSSLHRADGGLGLGLALVRSLVEQHQGRITAHSAGPGHGATFVVRLPVAMSAPEAPDSGDRTDAGVCRRVLVVEDKDDARESLRAVLELAGHEVRCAADGASAIDVAAEWPPEIALVDIGLPGLDGYEVAQRLRRTAAGRDIYLVAVTGYGQPADRRQALQSGFDEHVVKPVSADAVLRLVTTQRSWTLGQEE
jgi:signal transduction histidine kinase/ActR/RegA family two-component response regulator